MERESLIEALSPAERFALRLRGWANDAEARGDEVVPIEDIQFLLDEFGMHFPDELLEADRG